MKQMAVFVLFLAVLVHGPAKSSDVDTYAPMSLVSASAGAAPFSQIPDFGAPMVHKAGACRFDCERCRDSCYGRFRINCVGPTCRKTFSQCMKGCWNNICRYC
jgi:hypothetical protein